MGFQHHPQKLPDPSDIAEALPALSDRQAADAVHLAEGHEAVRRALLGLSGIALLQSATTCHPSDLAGIFAVVGEELSRGREAVARVRSSGADALAIRAQTILTVADMLAEQATRLTLRPSEPVSLHFLQMVLGLLSQTAVPRIGMRRFSSVSCAAYPSSAAEHQDPGGHHHAERHHDDPHRHLHAGHGHRGA